MPDKNEDLPDRKHLSDAEKTLLSTLLAIVEIVTSDRYITLENQTELDAYMVYMSYRVQQDLYAACQENGQFRDLSWDDFVLLLRGNRPARAAAIVVVRETLDNFYRDGHYNFDATEVNFNYGTDAGDDETGILHCSSLFSREEGFRLVNGFLLRAELALYRRLLNQQKGYSWQRFLDELAQKGSLWRQVFTAFQDALARLDFKPVWKSETLEELVLRAGAEEV